MGFTDYKITDAEIAASGVQSKPDKLVGTPAQNKAVFDALISAVVKEKLNGLIEALLDANAASEIGTDTVSGMQATNVQEAIAELYEDMQDITQGAVADGSITTVKLHQSAVTGEKMAAGAVGTGNIASNAVTAEKIAALTITAALIAAGAVTAEKLASGAVTTEKLAALNVTREKIANAAIDKTKLASGAVVTDKIEAGAVTAAKLAQNAVMTEKIAALAVTAEKLADSAVTSAKAGSGMVVSDARRHIFVSATEPEDAEEGDIWLVLPTEGGN